MKLRIIHRIEHSGPMEKWDKKKIISFLVHNHKIVQITKQKNKRTNIDPHSRDLIKLHTPILENNKQLTHIHTHKNHGLEFDFINFMNFLLALFIHLAEPQLKAMIGKFIVIGIAFNLNHTHTNTYTHLMTLRALIWTLQCHIKGK